VYGQDLVQHEDALALVRHATDEIFAEAVAEGMSTLREDGLRLAVAGLSSLDEVRRVTGDRLS
jgi:type II secretory ATPase GspE/PulE/Tfp pilus assembly ATPase PilB-like protein